MLERSQGRRLGFTPGYLMRSAVALASGISAAAGDLILDPASGLTGALTQALAGPPKSTPL